MQERDRFEEWMSKLRDLEQKFAQVEKGSIFKELKSGVQIAISAHQELAPSIKDEDCSSPQMIAMSEIPFLPEDGHAIPLTPAEDQTNVTLESTKLGPKNPSQSNQYLRKIDNDFGCPIFLGVDFFFLHDQSRNEKSEVFDRADCEMIEVTNFSQESVRIAAQDFNNVLFNINSTNLIILTIGDHDTRDSTRLYQYLNWLDIADDVVDSSARPYAIYEHKLDYNGHSLRIFDITALADGPNTKINFVNEDLRILYSIYLILQKDPILIHFRVINDCAAIFAFAFYLMPKFDKIFVLNPEETQSNLNDAVQEFYDKSSVGFLMESDEKGELPNLRLAVHLIFALKVEELKRLIPSDVKSADIFTLERITNACRNLWGTVDVSYEPIVIPTPLDLSPAPPGKLTLTRKGRSMYELFSKFSARVSDSGSSETNANSSPTKIDHHVPVRSESCRPGPESPTKFSMFGKPEGCCSESQVQSPIRSFRPAGLLWID